MTRIKKSCHQMLLTETCICAHLLFEHHISSATCSFPFPFSFQWLFSVWTKQKCQQDVFQLWLTHNRQTIGKCEFYREFMWHIKHGCPERGQKVARFEYCDLCHWHKRRKSDGKYNTLINTNNGAHISCNKYQRMWYRKDIRKWKAMKKNGIFAWNVCDQLATACLCFQKNEKTTTLLHSSIGCSIETIAHFFGSTLFFSSSQYPFPKSWYCYRHGQNNFRRLFFRIYMYVLCNVYAHTLIGNQISFVDRCNRTKNGIPKLDDGPMMRINVGLTSYIFNWMRMRKNGERERNTEQKYDDGLDHRNRLYYSSII